MTIEELRIIISAKTEKLQEGINKATSKLKGFKKTSDDMNSTNTKNVSKMKSEYDNLIKKLDIINAQAEFQQRKLSKLREEYSRMSSLGTDNPKTVKLQEQILRTESTLHRLINTSDKTSEKIISLENDMNNAGVSTGKANDKFNSLKDRLDKVKEKFKQTGSVAEKSTGKIAGFAAMINKSFMRILKRIFIFNLIYKMIRGLISYVTGALKTNNDFANSLNIIKTNLKVAFQPIYDFVLPAINALMRGLATLTSYIASFTSALFGKTYKQSYDAAKGIEKAKKEMKGYGGAAKKAGKEANGALAGFDEINPLDMNSGGDSGGGGGSGEHEMEMPDLTQIDEGPITRLKKLLSELFEPFKLAWENEGQTTINSIKNALESIGGLIKAIGVSFKEVWTNGSGQEILEILLRILQQIFNLIGNIANAFKIAWMENEIGTRIIQGIADIFIIILGIVESIGQSLNNVWGEVGQSLANTFMAILESTIGILHSLAEGLRMVWDNGGQHLFESFIKLGAKIIELAGYIYTEFVAPFVMWFISLMSPAIAKVMDWVGKLLDKFTELIDWLLGDGKPVLDTIITVLGSMAIALGIVKGAIAAKTVALGLGKGALIVFKTAIAAITSPVGLVVLAIGGLIAIIIGLWKTNEEFRTNVTKIWEQIKEIFKMAMEFIQKIIISIYGDILKFWENNGEAIKSITKKVWDFISNIINAALKVISGILDVFIGLFTGDWERMGEGIKNIWQGMWKAISTIISGAWSILSTAFSGLKDKISNWFEGLAKKGVNWGKNLISNFTDGINAMKEKAGNAAKGVASRVSDFLGFASPTKDGPGSKADKWMPNLMNMLADGIEDNVYKVSGAAHMTAKSLQGIQDPSNVMASAVGSAVMGAMQFNNNTSTSENQAIEISVDGIKLIRAILPKLDSEIQRMGYKTILRTE